VRQQDKVTFAGDAANYHVVKIFDASYFGSLRHKRVIISKSA
jgi:hypothetical protein